MPSLPITPFLAAPGTILDVRSPGEFLQGHIPGAQGFALFNDHERALVGTCYKHQGKEAAIALGLDIVGPKLSGFVATAKALAPDRQVRVHCWRGGMRSSSMGWLLATAGFEVVTLEGGYKSFRRWVREVLAIPKPIVILGGMTGTGKTQILHSLATLGTQVLDLEGMANHRGSSYGALGLPAQPTTEHFENLVAVAWHHHRTEHPTWIEAESRRIGLCRIPPELFEPMMRSPIVEVVRPEEERVSHLLGIYGSRDTADLITATERIRKRLGRERTAAAVGHIQAGRLGDAVRIILSYYDRAYQFDLERRQVPIYRVEVSGLTPAEIAQRVLAAAQE